LFGIFVIAAYIADTEKQQNMKISITLYYI